MLLFIKLILAVLIVGAKIKHNIYVEVIVIEIGKKRADIHIMKVLFKDEVKSKFHLEAAVQLIMLHLV